MLGDLILSLLQEGLWLSVIASLPAILASLVVGLAVALFSATTQIQEQTLSFAPKMIAVYVALVVFAAPLGGMIISFARRCFSDFALLGLGH